MHATYELDVLAARGERVQGRCLHCESKSPPYIARLSRDVESGDAGQTACRLEKGRQDSDRCSFACAVRTEETEQLARLDGEADAINGSRAAGVNLEQFFDFNDRASHCGARWTGAHRTDAS